jgi:hypothetical protein
MSGCGTSRRFAVVQQGGRLLKGNRMVCRHLQRRCPSRRSRRGTKPADLAVEQPIKFGLVANPVIAKTSASRFIDAARVRRRGD